MKKINFGTDGWRGIIADDFVYENIELFGWALISFVKEIYCFAFLIISFL